MSLPVAILAGGLATRLHPLTKTIPKSLIEMAGKPFIEWQLDYLKNQGIERVVLCVGYLGEQIEAYLGSRKRHDLELLFSYDGAEQLGTGGALKQALPLLGEAFFVLYGDSYLPISYKKLEDVFYQQKQHTLMTVFKNTNQWGPSNVWFENGVLLKYNKYVKNTKMNHIDYGLGVIPTAMFTDYCVKETFDLADYYHHCSRQKTLLGYEVFCRFYEIGSPQGLFETNLFLSTKLSGEKVG